MWESESNWFARAQGADQWRDQVEAMLVTWLIGARRYFFCLVRLVQVLGFFGRYHRLTQMLIIIFVIPSVKLLRTLYTALAHQLLGDRCFLGVYVFGTSGA